MGDISSILSGVGSIAGALGGGSGGGGGGTVVGGPTPAAAQQAGMYQVQAARAAAEASKAAMQDAINTINQNYTQARYDLQPYRQAGVQAYNELGQYLGLDAYNPGAAPTAPKLYTGADLLDKIKNSAVKNYIRENSGIYTDSKGFNHAQYTGAGAQELIAATPAYGESWALDKTGSDPGGGYTIAGNTGQGYNTSAFLNNPLINSAARLELANDLAMDKNATYDTQLEAYNKNLAEWQQNKEWYDQYTAEGPYSTQQITDKITNQPGYQAELGQGIDAIGKSSSARGYLGSGRALKELSQFGQNTLSKYYNNTLDRLSTLVQGGQAAATGTAGLSQQQGNAIAGLQTANGDTQANALLAAGNAQAQAHLAANQQYQIIGGNSGGGGGLK